MTPFFSLLVIFIILIKIKVIDLKRGGTFRIVAHFEPLIKSLERLHVLDELGKDKMYSSKFEAVNAATKDFDEHICKGCLREMFVECDRLREAE